MNCNDSSFFALDAPGRLAVTRGTFLSRAWGIGLAALGSLMGPQLLAAAEPGARDAERGTDWLFDGVAFC